MANNYNNIFFYPVEGYRPYYETPDGRVRRGPPVTFEDPDPRHIRDHVGAPSTSSYGAHFGGGGQPDRFRRDWRDGGHGFPYLHGVAPVEQASQSTRSRLLKFAAWCNIDPI